MPRLVFAIFCQQGVVDRFTNSLSILNQIDEVTFHPRESASTPSSSTVVRAGMPCSLVTLWERERPEISETSHMMADLIDPQGKRQARIEASIDLRKTARVRGLAALPGLPISGPGTYRFDLRVRSGVKWRRVGDVRFVVKFGPPQTLSPTASETKRAPRSRAH